MNIELVDRTVVTKELDTFDTDIIWILSSFAIQNSQVSIYRFSQYSETIGYIRNHNKCIDIFVVKKYRNMSYGANMLHNFLIHTRTTEFMAFVSVYNIKAIFFFDKLYKKIKFVKMQKIISDKSITYSFIFEN